MYIVDPRKSITFNLSCENDDMFSKTIMEIKRFFKDYNVLSDVIEYYTVCDNDRGKIYRVTIAEKPKTEDIVAHAKIYKAWEEKYAERVGGQDVRL